ncbi:MAG: penicillin acylase family protein, partial [Planctomycetota bacterium]|nr:penicillin acylase family protein [Planctomycetota bacterium]
GLLGALQGLAAQVVKAGAHAVSRQGILPRNGSLRLPGLSAPVSVAYDDHGVPHLRASSDADLFRAHGFVHALDRYFQMDMLRRVLRGRLAETVGEQTLGPIAMPPFTAERTTSDADAFMRALDLVPAARRVLAHADAEGRRLIGAYVSGVNAALPMLRRRKPIEYRGIRLPIKPWTPIDSILIAKGMAFGLSFKWRTAPGFGAIAERLKDKPEHLAKILPPIPTDAALAMTNLIGELSLGIEAFEAFRTPAAGSNAFVVGSARSESGMPILASDPHLELQLPAVWYLSSLVAPGYQAVGCSIPGIPGVVIGRNHNLSWGLTNGMIDDADLWLEEVDDAGKRYKVDGTWRRMQRETVGIRRRGTSPRLFTLRRTHRGPLLSDAMPGYEGPPLSLRMTLHENALDLESFLGLGRARDVDAALEAVRHFGSPAQNLLLADDKGQVGYCLMGNVPVRTQDHHPALPRDGTTTASDWQGFIPEDEMPRAKIAPEDVLVSANHPQVGAGYPHYLSHLYEPTHRAQRIQELLGARTRHTPDDLRRIQLDATNLCAREIKQHVLLPHAEAVRRARPAVGALLDRLLAWEGDERKQAGGAVPWHLFYHHLLRRTFEPVIGATLMRAWLGMINLVDTPLLAAFREPDSPWAPADVRASIVGEAMEATLTDLKRRGLTLASPWGDMHQLTLRHPAAPFEVLAPTFNQGPIPMDGGPFSVMSGQYMHYNPGRMVVGASYRHVVDMAHPEQGRMITFGGQSGHAGSPHYADLTPLWVAGETLPMRLETLPEGARTLDLLPG